MKKIIKIASLVVIFVLSVTINVYAAEPNAEVTLTPSATTAKVGETVTITVSAKCATKIEGIDSTLSWDNTKLELTNQDSLAANGFISMSGADDSTGKFKLSVLYGGSGETPTEAAFATLTFKVLDGAVANEKLTVALSEVEVGDSNDDWFEVNVQNVEITIVTEDGGNEPVEKPDEPEEKPTEKPDEQPEEKPTETPNDSTKNEENKDTSKDNTIADKTINHAGVANYAIIIFALAIITIALYAKCRTYKDIK